MLEDINLRILTSAFLELFFTVGYCSFLMTSEFNDRLLAESFFRFELHVVVADDGFLTLSMISKRVEW